MENVMKCYFLLVPLFVLSSNAFADHSAHWSYEGGNGPEHWAAMAPEFSSCGGKNQSPINLTGFIKAELRPIAFEYKTAGKEIINNGHTVQVNFDEGSGFELDSNRYTLKQL